MRNLTHRSTQSGHFFPTKSEHVFLDNASLKVVSEGTFRNYFEKKMMVEQAVKTMKQTKSWQLFIELKVRRESGNDITPEGYVEC